LRLKEKRGSLEMQTIRRKTGSGPAPLSYAQQQLWFLDQLEPGGAHYNLPMGLRVKGHLDLAVLQECLNQVVQRHEALRTHFEAVEGQAVQVIQPVASVEMPLVDLRGLVEPEREAQAQRLCVQESQRPFDLARDLLLRATVFQLGETDHILFLNMHHIASDEWSVYVLIRELKTLYHAFCEGKPSPLPELPIQYADYAVWQRDWLRGEMLEKQLNYWKTQLEGAPALLDLPADRPRPAKQSYRGALMPWELPKPLSVALGELSRREGVTLFMTLLAGFQTLLHRYTGSDEILVGSPIAGRTRTEIEPLIGFFVNTLVLRGDLSGNPSFRTLIGRTREVALGAYAHQDLPFERLVEELHPERDLSHSPLFQVIFVLQNAPWEAAQLAGLEVTPMQIDSGTSKFDLTLLVRERGGALQAVVEYNTDLFEAETIRRMLGHYEILLEGIVANPDRRLSDLPLLTGVERQQLLVEWNQTKQDYPGNKCVHELFEEQVERVPEATAVIFEDRQLTYRQVNEHANQLARYLQGLGVGPETLVGICVERSLEMVVGLLGILKAGGAYVPLDPSYPKERLAFMLEDTQAPVLLAQSTLLDRIPTANARVIRLALGVTSWAQESPENLDPAVRPENLAYVIYTSGSTGKPKGVQVLHRGVARLVFGVEYARFDASRVFLQLAPISFDASTLEIWGALLHGATCVIAPSEVQTPQEIGQLVRNHQVTTLWLTSSLYNTVIDLTPSALSSVSELLIGGEALSPLHVQRGLRMLPQTQMINGYGPTENTTFTCCYRIPMQFDRNALSIPIGRPISNTQVYILDNRRNPVPVGVAGELHIGGDGLARGYVNCPELTAEKFIFNPFSGEPGARLYRTGDLARYLPDGNIEFLGRTDHQVKVRGFRIELGEIESVLTGYPGVREAVVAAREDVPGDKRLVAYLMTSNGGEPPKVSELRSLLQAKLPEYMVPSAFVTLDRFPLTPNGKVDRKALPRPDLQSEPAGFVPPASATEKALANIWSEVLGIKQVGLHDNFFELGGHSLLATRAASRASAVFQVDLPLRMLFEHPALAGLAGQIDTLLWAREQNHKATPCSTKVLVEGDI
jgi:aspartate racemase